METISSWMPWISSKYARLESCRMTSPTLASSLSPELFPGAPLPLTPKPDNANWPSALRNN